MNMEQFSDRTKKVMQLANQEAQRFNHEFIGTEHLLLGLVKEGGGLGYTILKELDVDLRKIRLAVEKLLQSGPEMVTMGKLPQTATSKKVIEWAFHWRAIRSDTSLGTEHLLLGIVSEPEGIAGQVLRGLGVTTEGILAVLNRILTKDQSSAEEVTFHLIMQQALQQPVIDKEGTPLEKGYYWIELEDGSVGHYKLEANGRVCEGARYIKSAIPTFPPRIPAKVDTVLYRLKRDYGDIKAGYLFWGLECPNPRRAYDKTKHDAFMWEDIEEVKQ